MEAAVIDIEPEPTPTTSLVRQERTPGLVRPVATPDEVVEHHTVVSQLIVRALKEGEDYGTIPGAGDRKVLMKPGAERLCIAFGCRPDYDVVEKEIDHDREISYALTKWNTANSKPAEQVIEQMKAEGSGRFKKDKNNRWLWQERVEEKGSAFGLYRYVIRCSLIRQDGLVLGTGIGSCSSLESKYIRSPRDTENTILKMAQKRALVAATLHAFGLSDRFTQDIEDRATSGGNSDKTSQKQETKKQQPPPPAYDEAKVLQALREAPAAGATSEVRQAYFEKVEASGKLEKRGLRMLYAMLKGEATSEGGKPASEGMNDEQKQALAEAYDLLDKDEKASGA